MTNLKTKFMRRARYDSQGLTGPVNIGGASRGDVKQLVVARYSTATERLQTQRIVALPKERKYFVQPNGYQNVNAAISDVVYTRSNWKLVFVAALMLITIALLTAEILDFDTPLMAILGL